MSGQANPPLPTLRQLAEGMREAPIGWKKMPEVEEPYAAFERGLEQRIYRKSELRSYLEHRLRPDGQDSQPGPLHHHLASLAWAQTFPFIVDTNYDLLLRRAMQELRAPHTHSSLERNLKRPGQGCWYLSIYGDMTDWSEIVLTSEGQTPFEDRYRFLKGQLDLLLARHPVLFVGCSMLDPRLLEWVDGLTEAQREELNTWVALMSPGEAEALDEPLHDGRTARERYGDVLQVLELPSVEMLPRVFQAAAAEAVAEREQSEGELCITIHAEEARWRIEAAGHEHDVDPPDLKEMLTLLRKCAGQGLPCDERGAYVDQSSVAVESQMQQLAKSVGQALTELLPPAGLEVLQALAARSAGQDAALVRIQVHGDDKAANNALVLPWELLMLGDRFPVARGEVHIVREAVVPGLTEDQNRRGTLPRLSVVAHVAAPKGPGLPELNLEEASYRMSRALLEVEGQALFTEMGTLEDLREAAKRVSAVDRASKVDGESAVVLHFAGHGIPGQLVFENNDGGPDEVPAKRLLETLRDAMGKLPEAIWLSCCYGAGSGKPASEDDRAREWGGAGADSPSIAADLHRAGIPQILGYFGPVPDPLAVAVDRRLFEGLAETGSTLDAVRKARLRTQRPIDTRKGWARFPLSWTLLSLYHRGPNVPLVDVDQPPPPELERHLLEPGAEKLYGLKDLGLGFIGRRRLLARLRQERRKGERVLGLFGLGGLGKTATMMKVARVLLTDTQTKGGPSWQDRALMLPLQHLDGQEQLHADPFSVLREFVNQTVLAHPSCPADWSARLDAIERDEGPASRGRALAQLVRSVGRGGVLYIDNGETMQVERAAMDGARDRVPWRSAEVAEFFQAICEAVPSDTTVLLTTRYQPAETEGKWIPIEPCSEGEMLRMTRWHRWLKALPPVLREELVSGRMEGHPRAVEWTNELVGQQAARWEEQTGLSLTGSSVDTIRREVLEPALAGLPERAGADLLLETLLERQRPEALVLLGECCGIGLPVPLDVVRRMGDGADALRSRGLLTSMQEQRWGVHPFVREVVERRTDGPPWSKAGRAVLVEYWDEVCSEGAPEASHRELLEQALAAELWAKARATVATLSEAFRRRGWAKARLELIEGVTKQPWSDAERGWLLNRLSDALDSM
ncbi:MAG: SIR2 family protein, partial [Myxococcota bacterium]